MKKLGLILIPALAFSLTMGAVIAGNMSKNNEVINVGKADADYTLTLNDQNQPVVTGADDELTNNITDYIQFKYTGTGKSVASGRHMRYGTSGGAMICTKQIRKISSISVTLGVNNSNEAILYTGYTLEDIENHNYAYRIYGTAKTTFTVSCNYFSVESTKQFGISEVVVRYDCPNDESKAVVPAESGKMFKNSGDGSISYNEGIGSLTNCQSIVTDANGNPYSMKYVTYSVDLKFTPELVASSNDTNCAIQMHKFINPSGSLNAAFQFGITDFSTGAWAMKVSGTAKDSGTLDTPLVANTWYNFKAILTAKNSSYTLNCYIDDVLISSTTRGSLGRILHQYGLRLDTANYGAVQFRNVSVTGSN